MSWTDAAMVALVLCDPNVILADGYTLKCVEYTRKPYVQCMFLADRMRDRRRPESTLIPACITIQETKR